MMHRTYEVNVFGVVAVTHAMLPLLRQAPAARIVNVSSELGSMALLSSSKDWRNQLAYNSSKTALNAITLMYATELHDAGVLVNAVTPGYTSTALDDSDGGRPVEDGATVVVRAATLPPNGPSAQFIGSSGFFAGEREVTW